MEEVGLPIQSTEADEANEIEETVEESVEEAVSEPYFMVREVKLKEELEAEQHVVAEEIVISEKEIEEAPKKHLLERMTLNTTTLPYEGGFWVPSFSALEGSQWTEIIIDAALENTRWASLEQITSLSDITPDVAKPVSHRPGQEDSEGDLFPDLDDLRAVAKARTTSKRTSTGIPRTKTARKDAIPAAIQTNDIETSTEELVTEDEWIKPSEVVKKRKTSGVKPIPQPKTEVLAKSKKGKETGIITEAEEEVVDWQEPTREENESGDELVKPSEILKEKRSRKTNAKKSIPVPRKKETNSRPPPTAPDKKK
jgi:hypothetical protein